ncbi:hypothetical protein D3C78_1383060 [compost metagenome]
MIGLTLSADHHRIIGDLHQLLLLGIGITQREIVRRQELTVHERRRGGQWQAEGQQQGGAAADQKTHDRLRNRG